MLQKKMHKKMKKNGEITWKFGGLPPPFFPYTAGGDPVEKMYGFEKCVKTAVPDGGRPPGALVLTKLVE